MLNNRKKCYRKSRKKSAEKRIQSQKPEVDDDDEDTTTADDLRELSPRQRYRKRKALAKAEIEQALKAYEEEEQDLKKRLQDLPTFLTSSPRSANLFVRPPLKRTHSSPSQLLIEDADLLLKIQNRVHHLPPLSSTSIKLEDRRRYAPLTPAGIDRPKLLASKNGLISVEPTIRKSLSQGSLVKGTSIHLYEREEDEKMNGGKASPLGNKLESNNHLPNSSTKTKRAANGVPQKISEKVNESSKMAASKSSRKLAPQLPGSPTNKAKTMTAQKVNNNKTAAAGQQNPRNFKSPPRKATTTNNASSTVPLTTDNGKKQNKQQRSSLESKGEAATQKKQPRSQPLKKVRTGVARGDVNDKEKMRSAVISASRENDERRQQKQQKPEPLLESNNTITSLATNEKAEASEAVVLMQRKTSTEQLNNSNSVNVEAVDTLDEPELADLNVNGYQDDPDQEGEPMSDIANAIFTNLKEMRKGVEHHELQEMIKKSKERQIENLTTSPKKTKKIAKKVEAILTENQMPIQQKVKRKAGAAPPSPTKKQQSRPQMSKRLDQNKGGENGDDLLLGGSPKKTKNAPKRGNFGGGKKPTPLPSERLGGRKNAQTTSLPKLNRSTGGGGLAASERSNQLFDEEAGKRKQTSKAYPNS